jgi:hypothetical protein
MSAWSSWLIRLGAWTVFFQYASSLGTLKVLPPSSPT